MGNWKKSFRAIPRSVEVKLGEIPTQNIQVLAGKRITARDVRDGEYLHIGLDENKLIPGTQWDLIPPAEVGLISGRNQDGWETIRKDLPKYKKYFYQDIPIYGDASRNGWATVAIPREVYHKDSMPPYLFQLNISIQEKVDANTYGIVFSIDQIFDRESASFNADLLFALNLLQENTGTVGVVSAENPEFVFTSVLNWTVFPPGDLGRIVAAAAGSRIAGIDPETVRERLELFEQFKPLEYFQGLGGNDQYIGAKFAEDLVAFENLRYGNALYVMYANWEDLSRRPRSELLKLPHSEFDRIVHSAGWEQKFAVLMQQELQERGIRVRIGRHMRHRRTDR